MSNPIFESFLSTPEMQALFDADSVVQAMLDFESSLIRAQALEGIVPASAAEVIAATCNLASVDVDAIVAASGRAGSVAIPLVKALTEAVKLKSAEAARYVHWGSTSQDVIDTAMVLVTRRAFALVEADLSALTTSLLKLADTHESTPLLARTLMQPAQVISFGFKAISWIAPLVRTHERLREASRRALQLQLGGAVGTLAIMGDKGNAVARRMGLDLDLAVPPGPWHTQRDEWVSFGCEVGVLCGALGKIAKDISLLAQGEIGEVAEPSGGGRGGSSAMPHKRNPVSSMVGIAAATRAPHRVAALLAAMPQEHERGLGNWQAELAEWAGLWISAHGSVKALADAAAGLQVDAAHMRTNIDALHGLVFAEAVSMHFASAIGKAKAHHLIEGLSQAVVATGRPLSELTLEALREDTELSRAINEADVQALFDTDHAALPAIAQAKPQLATLAQRAAKLTAR
ncbi:3-carboxy-cis,cis-muconate cycloisomerase [soil metagenome]